MTIFTYFLNEGVAKLAMDKHPSHLKIKIKMLKKKVNELEHEQKVNVKKVHQSRKKENHVHTYA